MRNLLGRLHARRLPELLRIADAWSVPLHVESKGEVVGALYRAMSDPRTMRDVWDRLDPAERAMALVLADAPDAAAAPTLGDLAARLGVAEPDARETALRLYRAGILAREGDDEPLPIGASPRLVLPRELALQLRRLQDEMAAGDMTRAPLRVLIELLDDGELEEAARIWGLRTTPGVARRQDLATRLLRLVNDAARVERVVRGRGHDAAAIWRVVRAATEPMPLAEVARAAGLEGEDAVTVARRRSALRELESALLVWHAYRDERRWLFVPVEIRAPAEAAAVTLPPLVPADIETGMRRPWRHPDAVAWDLLTLLRIVADPLAPAWEPTALLPRWLVRIATPRLWFRALDGPPTGYLDLLQSLGLAEGLLAIDEEARPRRIVAGPHTRAWRGLSFRTQTTRLRDRWLRLPCWIEGESAGIVDVWGADWRGMRPRLLAALAAPDIGFTPDEFVTLESLAARLAACYPALLGPSFTAATARQGGEVGAGVSEDEARSAALADVIALELNGPFTWFGLTEIRDRPGHPRAIYLTTVGSALASGKPVPQDEDASAGLAPLVVDPSGEITLRAPTPERVWGLSAFTEPVDLAQESHYRLTPGSIAAALANGIERDQIIGFLERGSRQPLPPDLSANLAAWDRARHRLHLRRAVIVRGDDEAGRATLLQSLHDAGWDAQPLGDRSILVMLPPTPTGSSASEEALLAALRAAGHTPQWDEGIR
jgi:hypothetical protein